MAITRFRNSSILNRGPKYNDFLAGLPFRPIIGTATDGGTGTTVSVAFTGNNSAGAGVTYTALSSPGNITATGPASPITVSGLTAGTAYTFQVKAGNSLGDSAYSASSNSVTPVVPTSFESIATISGTGSSGTISFTSIPGTYAHLQVRIYAKNSSATSLYSRLNSDTGSNYAWHNMRGNGASAAAAGASSQARMAVIGFSDDLSTAQPYSAIIDILDYANTNKNKTIRTLAGQDNNGSGEVALSSGLWQSTAAITAIEIYAGAGNFGTDSRFALYGIKGA